jgi:hypothetical protein
MKDSRKQDSPPAAGRFRGMISYRRRAILPEGFFVSQEYFPVIQKSFRILSFRKLFMTYPRIELGFPP